MRHSRTVRIEAVVILPQFVEKLAQKHHLEPDEVYEVIVERPENRPVYRFFAKGNEEGEDLWAAFGQTEAGRYVVVFFIYKLNHEALVISGRDMTEGERRWYGSRRSR